MSNAFADRYRINVSFNALSLLVNTIAGMGLARLLTHYLTVEGYGLISMALALTIGVNIFTTSMNSAVGRFLTISLTCGDHAGSNRIFNSALFGHLITFVSLLPIVLVVSWFSPQLFNLLDNLVQVRIFTLLVLFAALVMTIATIFSASCVATARFDILSGLQSSLVLSRLAIILTFFYLWTPNPILVGTGMLLAAALNLFLKILVWHRLTPMLNIAPGLIHWQTIKDMFGMGVWVSVDTIGMLLTFQLNTVLIGKLVDHASAGLFGLYLTATSYLLALGSALAGPVTPEIYYAHAKNDQVALDRVLHSGARVSLSFLAMLSALLIGFRNYFVRLWLGEGYEGVASLLAVGAPFLAFSISLAPLIAALIARMKTAWIALATVGSGIGHLATCTLLYNLNQFSVYSVAISGGVWVVIKAAFLMWVDKGEIFAFAGSFLRLVWYFLILFLPPLMAVMVWNSFYPVTRVEVVSLSFVSMVTLWFAGTLWVLKPSDFGRVLGRVWSDSQIGKAHESLWGWKVKIFSSRHRSTYTLFLRNPLQFEVFVKTGIPLLLGENSSSWLRILVIGCSSGAEVYSIASELVAKRPDVKFSILGLDIDEDKINQAQRGIYSREEVWCNPRIPAEFVCRTFEEMPCGDYKILEKYIAMVKFRRIDVRSPDLADEIGKWDVVFAQNILIHMRRREAVWVFRNILKVLAPYALLFIDGVDLDLKEKLTRSVRLEPLNFWVEEIHTQNERRFSWPESYVGLEPFNRSCSDPTRRYSTIFYKAGDVEGCASSPDALSTFKVENRATY